MSVPSPSLPSPIHVLTPESYSITATGHGKAADYWAFGILLFELLAGYPPFFADSPLEICTPPLSPPLLRTDDWAYRRKDPERNVRIPQSHRLRRQGPHQATPHRRPHEASWEPARWRERYHGPPMVRGSRLERRPVSSNSCTSPLSLARCGH